MKVEIAFEINKTRKFIWVVIFYILAVFIVGALAFCFVPNASAGEVEELQWKLYYWKEVKTRAILEIALADRIIPELTEAIKTLQPKKAIEQTKEDTGY